MKVSPAQNFNAAIALMSGVMADPETNLTAFSDDVLQKYIDIAQRTANLIPEVEQKMPDDDEIREAMHLILAEGNVGALLLSDSLMKRFDISRHDSYVITQRAGQLGIIEGKPVSKNKIVYSLVK